MLRVESEMPEMCQTLDGQVPHVLLVQCICFTCHISSPSYVKAAALKCLTNTMKSTIHKLVLNVILVTHPTQYIKLGKCKLKYVFSVIIGNFDVAYSYCFCYS